MLAFLFPGQGAQSAGFLHRLPAHSSLRPTLDEASDLLGLDVLTLDTAEALHSTVAVQTGLLVAGVAMLRAFAGEQLAADISAGLSVGAFAAAVSCGALEFADALKLVNRRAHLMEDAYPSGYGLAAINGLNETEVERLAQTMAEAGDARIYIGNVNAPRQIVVAGSNTALDVFCTRALEAGARKANRLDVAVPSHCELLSAAAEELRFYAEDLPWRAPTSLYVSNRGGRPTRNVDAIRDDLATNMRHTVRWFDALTAMAEMGARILLEAPPGQVLTNIAREHLGGVTSLSVEGQDIGRLAAIVRTRQADST